MTFVSPAFGGQLQATPQWQKRFMRSRDDEPGDQRPKKHRLIGKNHQTLWGIERTGYDRWGHYSYARLPTNITCNSERMPMTKPTRNRFIAGSLLSATGLTGCLS